MIIAILTRLTPFLPCERTGEITPHYAVYFNKACQGMYCSKCVESYIALLQEFAPSIKIIIDDYLSIEVGRPYNG